ncbi:hypothetical protein J6590_026307 [Homalodisca vitripennis]|nr:hypothetical protein J6590_026307 [Homalodisca vitripennis]
MDGRTQRHGIGMTGQNIGNTGQFKRGEMGSGRRPLPVNNHPRHGRRTGTRGML